MPKKKVLMAVLALIFAVMQILPAFANELEDKQAEYDDVQQKMQQMEIAKERARREAEAASDRMEEIVAELNRLQAEIKEIEAKRDKLQPLIDENQEVLTEKKAKMEGRMKIYRQRLRDIYINGQINYLDVLLGAKDFSDFSSRMFLLQKIISRDLAMMDTIMKETAEIEARQKELDAQMADIEKMRSDLDEKQQKAEASKGERAQLLYRAEEESRQADEDYDRLLAISENIASMLRSLERSSSMPTGGGTGKFIWPVTGEITSYYGWRTHPVFGTTRYHSGMDIACDYGTPIVAADSGTVIYSGWMGGYGYAVMIDHGGGLVSLYGHNQELAVSEGQYVNKGQVISYAGSTGWSTGPHCHFEVRIHGEVTEPLDYLP